MLNGNSIESAVLSLQKEKFIDIDPGYISYTIQTRSIFPI